MAVGSWDWSSAVGLGSGVLLRDSGFAAGLGLRSFQDRPPPVVKCSVCIIEGGLSGPRSRGRTRRSALRGPVPCPT